MSAWCLRPYEPSRDEDGVVYLWLKSFAHSQHGRRLGAHQTNSDAERRYWAEHRQIVMRLLCEADTQIVCDPEDDSVIWAFATTQDDVIHYVSCKRSFHREGISSDLVKALLGDRLEQPCLFTHELVELGREDMRAQGLSVPRSWRHDPYWFARNQGVAISGGRVSAA